MKKKHTFPCVTQESSAGWKWTREQIVLFISTGLFVGKKQLTITMIKEKAYVCLCNPWKCKLGNGPKSKSCCFFQLTCLLGKNAEDFKKVEKTHICVCNPWKRCRLEMDQRANLVVYFNWPVCWKKQLTITENKEKTQISVCNPWSGTDGNGPESKTCCLFELTCTLKKNNTRLKCKWRKQRIRKTIREVYVVKESFGEWSRIGWRQTFYKLEV